MKKKIIIIAVIVLALTSVVLMRTLARPKGLASLISYDIPEGWSEGLTSYWQDDGKTVSEITYENADGYMAVSICTFRGSTPYGGRDDAKEAAGSLNEAEMITVDGRDCYIGWRGMDDHEKVSRAAYIFDGDYVIEIYLANSDNTVTEEQMRGMQLLIDSIHFN